LRLYSRESLIENLGEDFGITWKRLKALAVPLKQNIKNAAIFWKKF
jgi:hypothetical protein